MPKPIRSTSATAKTPRATPAPIGALPAINRQPGPDYYAAPAQPEYDPGQPEAYQPDGFAEIPSPTAHPAAPPPSVPETGTPEPIPTTRTLAGPNRQLVADLTFARSLIYSGMAALVLGLFGVAMIGIRRRGW